MSNKHDLPPLPDPDERTRKGCAFSAFAMHDYAIAAIQRLEAENANLRSVMVAAAEEIAAHWEAHCDDEGYGPANLMHRLEKGIPTKYCYTAGDFARLKAKNEALKKDAERLESENEALRKDASALDLDAAAKKLAECIDYPWDCLHEQNRTTMRQHAREIIDAAMTKEQKA